MSTDSLGSRYLCVIHILINNKAIRVYIYLNIHMESETKANVVIWTQVRFFLFIFFVVISDSWNPAHEMRANCCAINSLLHATMIFQYLFFSRLRRFIWLRIFIALYFTNECDYLHAFDKRVCYYKVNLCIHYLKIRPFYFDSFCWLQISPIVTDNS